MDTGVGAYWQNIVPLEISVMVPHKNGCTSVGQALKDYLGIRHKKARRWRVARFTDKVTLSYEPEYDESIFIIRHPEDRFKSLWKNKARDGKSVEVNVKGQSPDQLLDTIQTRDDPHWRKQSDFLGSVKPKYIVTIDQFGQYWWQLTGKEFPHKYATEGDLELTPWQKARLEEMYWEDYYLWRMRETG